MFHFHKVAWVHYLGEVSRFYVCKNVLPAYSSAKIINVKRVFPELWSQRYCHRATFFLWITVYNFNCRVQNVKNFLKSLAVMFCKSDKIWETMDPSRKWYTLWPIKERNFQWPWVIFKTPIHLLQLCKSFQMRLFVQLCSIWLPYFLE